MGVQQMELRRVERLGIHGHATMRAYPRGLLQRLMDEGHTYEEAKRLAREHTVDEKETDNLIVDAGKHLVARVMGDEAGWDTGITVCAIGIDNTAPAVSDTVLGNEGYRKWVTSATRSDNVVTFSTFFTGEQAEMAIEEVGLFGHKTATLSADSGELFNRLLLSYDNSAGEVDVTFDIEVTFG